MCPAVAAALAPHTSCGASEGMRKLLARRSGRVTPISVMGRFSPEIGSSIMATMFGAAPSARDGRPGNKWTAPLAVQISPALGSQTGVKRPQLYPSRFGPPRAQHCSQRLQHQAARPHRRPQGYLASGTWTSLLAAMLRPGLRSLLRSFGERSCRGVCAHCRCDAAATALRRSRPELPRRPQHPLALVCLLLDGVVRTHQEGGTSRGGPHVVAWPR